MNSSKSPFLRVLAFIHSCLAAILAFLEYLAYREVYVGHFGRSLDFDWAMKNWYFIAFLMMTTAATLSLVSVWMLAGSKDKAGRIVLSCSVALSATTFILVELALPYWFKYVQLLNYGKGG